MTLQDLASLSLFDDVPDDDLARFARISSVIELQADEQIFAQGEPATKLFILLDGEVAIRFKPGDGEPLTVTVLGRGDVFGWSSALGRSNYTSGAFCTARGRAVLIPGAKFRRLCDDYPKTGIQIIERLADVIAGRLRGTRQAVAELLHNGYGAKS